MWVIDADHLLTSLTSLSCEETDKKIHWLRPSAAVTPAQRDHSDGVLPVSLCIQNNTAVYLIVGKPSTRYAVSASCTQQTTPKSGSATFPKHQWSTTSFPSLHSLAHEAINTQHDPNSRDDVCRGCYDTAGRRRPVWRVRKVTLQNLQKRCCNNHLHVLLSVFFFFFSFFHFSANSVCRFPSISRAYAVHYQQEQVVMLHTAIIPHCSKGITGLTGMLTKYE